jgi:hypothetical protein
MAPELGLVIKNAKNEIMVPRRTTIASYLGSRDYRAEGETAADGGSTITVGHSGQVGLPERSRQESATPSFVEQLLPKSTTGTSTMPCLRVSRSGPALRPEG